MPSKKERKEFGSRHLHRIIESCKSVEEKGIDPFIVDIDDIIFAIRKYFPEWELLQELCLDSEAINHLASIIKLQSEWVKQRSTSLYRDPFLLEEKIMKLKKEEIAELFLKSWHPIIELEQISPKSLVEALKYWKNLLPIAERWLRTGFQVAGTEPTSTEELIEIGIMSEKAFSEEMEILYEELKRKAGGGRKILYWDFIGASTFIETIRRAYLTSFLITYGYATMEVNRLEEEIVIAPFEKKSPVTGKIQGSSIPVSIDLEEWIKWRRERGIEEKSLLRQKD